MNLTEHLKLKKTYSYAEYLAYVESLASHKDTSGLEKTPERIEATKINLVRLNRIYKTVQLRPALLAGMKKISKPTQWLLILEAWCGDGAQTAPVIARMAHHSPFVSLKIILRDEHPEVMDRYLTNGSRSIPKLIVYDGATLAELAIWGPRPAAIQERFLAYKRANPTLAHADHVKQLHLLYARDQTNSLQEEMLSLLLDVTNKQGEPVSV